MRILIAGGGLQGLSCGCSLYKNHEVSVVTSNLMCRKSHFFKKVYSDVKASDESLYNLLEKEHFDVLIPVSDMIVPFISKNKPEIERRFGVKCAVPDYEQVYQVEDKSRFMTFCEENDVPHPKTARLSEDTLKNTANEVGFPALIKPDYSVGARGITKVNSIAELQEKYPSVSQKYGSCTLQEFIENKEYYFNVMLYRDAHGKFPAYTILKIVRMYPIGAGSSACCITVENDNILQICKDCLDKLNWVGMADFDVLQRLDNGAYKIIEINPRVPASLRAAAISGVNFPEIIANDALGKVILEYKYNPGKVLRYMGIDIMWLMKSPSRFHAKPGWLKFFGKDIFYQDIYKQDPSTWWTWLAEGLGKINGRNKKLR
jgi:predicted ATP-grasp superfamily ATP-dependent carboligase